MANEHTEVKNKDVAFIDDCYVIPEFIDEMIAAKDNLIKVRTETAEIKEVLKKVEQTDAIKNAIAGFETHEKNILEQIRKLNFKINCLTQMLNVATASNAVETRFAISMLLEGLGLVNKECVDVKDRKEVSLEKKDVN